MLGKRDFARLRVKSSGQDIRNATGIDPIGCRQDVLGFACEPTLADLDGFRLCQTVGYVC
jgi:hypothetical protein